MSEGKWKIKSTPFWTRDLLQGRVVAVADNPFQAEAGDWHWLLNSIGRERLLWPVRHGFSSRFLHEEFLQFEIPGLHGVPVTAMLTMITLFAIGIGPVNYFVLWKRRKLSLLIFTIPVVAFLTSLTLFAYSTLSHGFGVKTRTRSLTLLDQNAHTAVTTARLSLFAGLSPSSGLKFSPETAVHAIWHGGSDPFQTGRVNWTSTQAFESGWLRSRTRTQLVVETHRTERGRLVIRPLEGEMLPVENGFEWDVLAMVVADDRGTLYAGPALSAGAATRLRRVASKDDLDEFYELLALHPVKMPEGAGAYGGPRHSTTLSHVWIDTEQAASFQFSESAMEKTLAKLSRLTLTGNELPPKTYVLILKDNPGIEKGVDRPNEQAPLHVLVGRY